MERLCWLQAPMWAFDIEARRMVWANAAGLELWNAKSLAELASRDFSDMSEAAVTRFRAALAQMAAGEVLHEQWTLYPRGMPTTVSVARVAVQLEDGTLASLQEAQSAALVDPETLRGVEALHHTSVRIALFLRDGDAVMQNPSAIRTFGVLQSGGERGAFAALFVDPAEAARAHAALDAGEVYSAEVALRTAEGPRWHGIDARAVPDPVTGKPLILVNARDIQDRRTAEVALVGAVENQKRFLAAISHEIRTPLNSVVGFVELLQGTSLNEQQSRHAHNAHTSAQHLLALVSDVLDVSKVQAEQLEISGEALDIEDVLLESLVIASTQMKPGVSLTYTIPEVETFVLGDRLRLMQIFVNLLGNAAKFTEQGFVRLRLSILAPAGPDTVSLLIVIEDTGIGIPPNKIGDLFMPFAQAHNPQRGGTGLGLYLSRSLARIMGGDIVATSTVGEGSQFSVKLNLPRGRSRLEELGMGGQRLLLLTRDPELLRTMPDRFRRAGAEVVALDAPSLALQACLTPGAAFEVILLDLELTPNALALASVLREVSPRTRIIGLATSPLDAEAPGLDVVITRPFSFYRLAKLLETEAASRQVVAHVDALLRGMRVLVAEDVELNISLLQEMFRAWYGLGFDVARDGQEAVQMALGGPYDLILMDMHMPRLGGIEAIQQIRAQGGRVPIVALTASAMSDDVERARAAGVDGYLPSPCAARTSPARSVALPRTSSRGPRARRPRKRGSSTSRGATSRPTSARRGPRGCSRRRSRVCARASRRSGVPGRATTGWPSRGRCTPSQESR